MGFSFSLPLFALLAVALGFKHCYDADHLVAVANFMTRSKGMRDTSKMALSWTVGHMVTAAVITVLLFFAVTQVDFVTRLLSQFDLAVAIMLIMIGVVGIFLEVPTVHEHPHKHVGRGLHSHIHRHRFGGLGVLASRMHFHHSLFGVGIVHGLASNDELIALFVVGLGFRSLDLLLSGVAVFTVGVALGMILFGVGVTYPILKYGVRRVRMVVNVASGSLSIIYGLMIIVGLGGFNPFNLFTL